MDTDIRSLTTIRYDPFCNFSREKRGRREGAFDKFFNGLWEGFSFLPSYSKWGIFSDDRTARNECDERKKGQRPLFRFIYLAIYLFPTKMDQSLSGDTF